MLQHNSDRAFYGYDRQYRGDMFVLVYEIWENRMPDKVVGGDCKKHIPGLLSEDQISKMIPF